MYVSISIYLGTPVLKFYKTLGKKGISRYNMVSCMICLNSLTESEKVSKKYTNCPADHIVCQKCYIRVLKICFCKSRQGEVMYKCPLCRNKHYYKNKEVYKVLEDINRGNHTLYLTPHGECKTTHGIPNLIRKCTFMECGCRIQGMDLEYTNDNKSYDELIQKHFKSHR